MPFARICPGGVAWISVKGKLMLGCIIKHAAGTNMKPCRDANHSEASTRVQNQGAKFRNFAESPDQGALIKKWAGSSAW